MNRSRLQKAVNGRCLDLSKKNVVWVSGSGRSGTSWLANLINYRNDFRYIFEPLNPRFLPYRDIDIDWMPSPDDSDPLLTNIITGKVSTHWANSRNRKWIAKARLIKAIRSNMMVPWINKNFPEAKVVLLIRNPLAVAASRKKLSIHSPGNWEWRPSPEVLLAQPSINNLLTLEEQHLLSAQLERGVVFETIVDWIITNILAFRLIDFETNHLVFYESLARKKHQVIDELFNFVQVPKAPEMEVYFDKKSDTTRNSGDGLISSSPLEAWKQVLTEQEISESRALLANFSIDRFYTESFEPVGA